MSPEHIPYAGRGGEKLASALDAFELSVKGAVCADFGSATGGFCDCLLRRGAVRVHSVDTCYGQLDWKLRKDPRVEVHERTNALHAKPPEQVELVTIDVGWTPQRLIIPAAESWLRGGGYVVSLLKPIYELRKLRRGRPPRKLEDDHARAICSEVLQTLIDAGHDTRAVTTSPVRGKGGNLEFFLLLLRA
ncbi:MAG: SAM-dependent methyltransferase [Phycisphaerae bacterium]